MVSEYVLGESETVIEWVATIGLGLIVARFFWYLFNLEKWVVWAVNEIRGLVGLTPIGSN